MSPLVQTLIVVLIVAAAVTYVSRRVWQTVAKARRARATSGACGDGCCK